jgi:hypothetical protein
MEHLTLKTKRAMHLGLYQKASRWHKAEVASLAERTNLAAPKSRANPYFLLTKI